MGHAGQRRFECWSKCIQTLVNASQSGGDVIADAIRVGSRIRIGPNSGCTYDACEAVVGSGPGLAAIRSSDPIKKTPK